MRVAAIWVHFANLMEFFFQYSLGLRFWAAVIFDNRGRALHSHQKPTYCQFPSPRLKYVRCNPMAQESSMLILTESSTATVGKRWSQWGWWQVVLNRDLIFRSACHMILTISNSLHLLNIPGSRSKCLICPCLLFYGVCLCLPLDAFTPHYSI